MKRLCKLISDYMGVLVAWQQFQIHGDTLIAILRGMHMLLFIFVGKKALRLFSIYYQCNN